MTTKRPLSRRAALGSLGAALVAAGARSQASATSARGVPQRTADYVIVGAGSSGCVLANRLSVAGDRTVLLLEAGMPDTLPAIHDPSAWPQLMASAVDWKYRTSPQPAAAGRQLDWPRGRTLGGSSSINALMHHRGLPPVYDSWARDFGCVGWDFASLLPLFKRSEDFSGGDPIWRGTGGPLHVQVPVDSPAHPVGQAFLAAARETGHALRDDINGAPSLGAGWDQFAVRDGRRQSASVAFLRPALGRPNLTVQTDTLVERLTFRGDRCVGLVARHGGERIRVTARQEVILCAGAVGSPQLLQLSGIGPAQLLRRQRIRIVSDVRGVGANLHDHLMGLPVAYLATRVVPRCEFRYGIAMLYADLDGPGGGADTVLGLQPESFLFPQFGTLEAGKSYGIVPCIMRPRSRGSLQISAASIDVPPRIDPAYLTHPDDLVSFRRAYQLAREVGAGAAFSDWRSREQFPGLERDVDDLIRGGAFSFSHPVGTCRMGGDAESVVDPQCRVRGIRGLRVADASIMPTIVDSPTNATALAIGEKVSDLVLAG